MKFFLAMLLFALLAVCAVAVAPQKAVIVTYPNSTPDSVVEQAKKAIEDAGGYITHEYKIIKAFAAQAPAKVLETVQAWGAEYNAKVEEDQIVHAYDAGH